MFRAALLCGLSVRVVVHRDPESDILLLADPSGLRLVSRPREDLMACSATFVVQTAVASAALPSIEA